MLHLKGNSPDDVFERFKKELNIYIQSGIDGVMVENYYGNYEDLKEHWNISNQIRSVFLTG